MSRFRAKSPINVSAAMNEVSAAFVVKRVSLYDESGGNENEQQQYSVHSATERKVSWSGTDKVDHRTET